MLSSRWARALSFAIALATLASPLLAATFTVTTTADTGAGSLRQAISNANGAAGIDAIAFDVSGAGCDSAGICTIAPASAFPVITGPIMIDGYTQPGSSPNTNATGAINAVLKIVLSGAGVPGATGLFLNADDSTIRGLAIGGFNVAIQPFFSNNSKIQGCFLGVTPAGDVALGNIWGINAEHGTNLTIGGPAAADRNLVSGNDNAIIVFRFPGSLIQGNLVGTTASGVAELTNLVGVAVALDTGTITIADNVISGNGAGNGWGIQVGNIGNSGDARNYVIQGNYIGTDATGSILLGNHGWGIVLTDKNITVGGTVPGQGNVIAHNRGGLVYASNGSGHSPIRGNSFYSNDAVFAGISGIGIDFGNDGVTPNDLGDADGGANDLQNFPVITSAESSGGNTTIVGRLNSLASTTFAIDFYANPVCVGRPQGFLEGQTYLGAVNVTTDGSGNAAINAVLPVTIEPGAPVTATATSPDGNTSEFSQRIVLSSSPSSGPAAGGTTIALAGFHFLADATVTVGTTPATNVVVSNYNQITATTPALGPGTLHGIKVTNTDGAAGTLPNGWVADFLDVPAAQQFHSFVTTLVSNAITAGVGGGLYGVTQDTLRQQMAVFLLKAKYGLCYTPPPCTVAAFTDVPCSSGFAPWINELVAEGITGGCGGGNYCPTSPVLRQQMAVLLLRTYEAPGYAPPACVNATFTDVPCSSSYAPWIYELVARNITAGCGGGNYCPTLTANRGQMATFVVKTFSLQ